MPNRTNSNNLLPLYDKISEKYDIGDYETFSTKMTNPESRKRLYDKVTDRDTGKFDLGSFDYFNSTVTERIGQAIPTAKVSVTLPFRRPESVMPFVSAIAETTAVRERKPDMAGISIEEIEKIEERGLPSELPEELPIGEKEQWLPGVAEQMEIKAPLPRGLLKEIAYFAPAGVISTGETIMRALQTATIPIGVDDWFEAAADLAEEKYKPFSPTIEKGPVQWVRGGLESSVQSLGAGIPGAIAIFALGGAPIIGWALGAGGMFTLAEYSSFMSDLKKGMRNAGATDKEVKLAEKEFKPEAIVSAVAEGGLEAAGNLFMIKMLGLTGSRLLKPAVKKSLLGTLKSAIKVYSKVMPVENVTEMLTAGIQNEARKRAGFEGLPSNLEAAFSVVGQVAVQSALMVGAGTVAKEVGVIRPEEVPVEPGEPIAEVKKPIAEVPEVVEPIPAIPETEAIQEAIREAQKKLLAGDEVFDVVAEINAQKEKEKAKADVKEKIRIEEERVQIVNAIKETALKVEEKEIPLKIKPPKPKILIKKAIPEKPVKIKIAEITPEKEKFIESKIKELGTIEAVEKRFKENTKVDKYARKRAQEIYGIERPFKFDLDSTEKEGKFNLYAAEEIKPDTYKSQTSIEAMDIEEEKGIRYLVAEEKEGDKVIQAIRFKKDTWDAKEATKWFEANKDKFEFTEEKIETKPRVRGKTEIEISKESSEDIYLNMGIPLVLPDAVQKKINVIKKLFKEPEGINKKSWDIVKDYVGKKARLEFEYSDKWNRTLRVKVPVEGKKTILRKQKFKDKFSSNELEDAIFYRQKTSNIWKGKTDTFENVTNRMPQELKDFVDGEVDEHIRNWRKTWNMSPFTKNIEAREEVIKTYLAGVYAGNIKKGYEYLVGLKGRSFVVKNFMLNKKTYLNFEEAFKKGGLVPRFRNLADQLNYQDAHMIKLFMNNELIGRIHELEKELNIQLIVRTNSKLYDEAKSAKDEDGNPTYVSFNDPWLRSFIVGKKADGSPIWTLSKAPALIERDLADAILSIFSKDAYTPDNIFWQNYDIASSVIRYTRVTFSGFHFVPLIESLTGGKGLSVLNFPKWVANGKRLLDNPVFMAEAKEAMLRFKPPSEVSRSQIEGSVQKVINVLEAQEGIKKVVGKGIKYLTYPQFRLTRFLFDEYLPLLKIQMYYNYKQKALSFAENKDIKPDTEQMKELNRDVASTVNDQFGGQAWEMIRVLNDPKIMKWMHRFVGYPDWSISAIRQASAVREGGIRGKLARRYWLRYGIAFMAVQNALSYLFTGLYNDDKDDDKIKWSWDKAHSTFKNKDPSLKHKIDFQLPDIEIDLPLIGKFNPGRERRKDGTYGRRYYSHFGKQMLEIPRYVLNFNEQMFAKSNPVIQIVFKQMFGGTPYKGGIFPARGEFTSMGDYESWKGKKGLERWRERAIQIVTDVTPFSIQSAWTTSPATAGLLPISKATSLYAAREYIKRALEKENANELLNIEQSLLDSGYKASSIQRTITEISSGVEREMMKKKRKAIMKRWEKEKK